MRSATDNTWLWAAAALTLWLGAACNNAVTAGLPPLVNGCQTSADCASAGAQFQCFDGGCAIEACSCDDTCPAALACCRSFDCIGQCQPGLPRTTPCDAGTPDAGQPDAGADAGA